MSFATPVRGGEFSGAPTPLWKALKFLDDHGYVRLNLLYHEIKKDGADPLGWIVTNKETAVLDVPVIDSASGEEMAFHKTGQLHLDQSSERRNLGKGGGKAAIQGQHEQDLCGHARGVPQRTCEHHEGTDLQAALNEWPV